MIVWFQLGSSCDEQSDKQRLHADGMTCAEEQLCMSFRYTNIQLINTIGVAEEDKRECLECWCKDKKDHGSFFCCKNCPAKDGPAVDYHLEYAVTYR